MEILKIENLNKEFQDGQGSNKVLENVNISIDKGEFVAIMGPSGSGKSTLLNILGGLLRQDSGSVKIDGYNLEDLDDSELALFRRREIGIVYQFYNLIDSLTVEQNIILPVAMDGKKAEKNLFLELIETMGIASKLKAFPNTLSGGEKQRVAIARALINRPALLLLDEPTGNLDIKNKNQIIDLLKKYNNDYKQTLIVVTHDIEVAKNSSKVYNLYDGDLMEVHYEDL